MQIGHIYCIKKEIQFVNEKYVLMFKPITQQNLLDVICYAIDAELSNNLNSNFIFYYSNAHKNSFILYFYSFSQT